MAQKPQIIDVTRSYVPGDPNSYPETLISTQREDGEEKLPPVSIYEGYNFMPTPYGYKSYFGTQAKLDIPALTSRTQFVLSYQSAEYVNNLIALCEDGIWIIDPTDNDNVWKHVITHTFSSSVFEEWTWCIIENALYCYKQGHASYYHTSDVNDVPNGLGISIVSVVPTFLNMAGQMGIFKAGTRLGFWDSANSVSWSSNLELNEFTPSLENLAGNTIFGAVLGRITHVRDHGEGFIVYSTKSIVGVSYEASSNLLWDAHTISTVGGVAVGREVTTGSGNSEQFAWTTVGLFRIGSYNGLTKVTEFQPVAIELSDLLKESRNPVYLNCIDGRFLYLHCIDNAYINGITSFESVYVGDIPIDGIPLLDSQLIAPSLLAKMIQKIEKDTADSTYGATLTPYVADATPFDVIEWEMSFRMPSTLGLYERDQNPGLGAKFDYLGTPGDLNRLDRTIIDYGPQWDNRTPTDGKFVPFSPTKNYAPLSINYWVEALLSEEVVMDRSTLLNINLDQVLHLPEVFQVDAFLVGSYDGQVPPGSIIQEACNLNPSYLTLSARTGNGLLGEMYHIASLWKEYEKRQDLVIKRLQELCANAKDNHYTIYSAVAVVVGDPALASTTIYKPYGSVGIMPMDKGFFFYKQYREFYDFTMVATRDETVILHKQVADGQYSVPCTYAIESQVDLKVTTQAPAHIAFPRYGYTANLASSILGSTGTRYTIKVSIAIKELATGKVSDNFAWSTINIYSTNGVLKIELAEDYEIPAGYLFVVYFIWHLYTIEYPTIYTISMYTGNLSTTIDLNSFTMANILDLPTLTSLSEVNLESTGNTYIPTIKSLAGWSAAVVGSLQEYNGFLGVYNIYVALLDSFSSNGRVGPRIYLGTVDITEEYKTIYITAPTIIDYTGYRIYIQNSDGYIRTAYGHLGASEYFTFFFDTVALYPSETFKDPDLRPLTWDQNKTGGDPTIYILSLPTTSPYSPTLIRDLIESSQVTPISWPDLGGAISFKDVDNYNQLLTAPWQLDGYIGVKAEIPGAYPIVEYNVQVKAKQLVHVTNVAPEFMYPGQVSFKVQRESLAMYEEYPFLMADPGLPGVPGVVGVTVPASVSTITGSSGNLTWTTGGSWGTYNAVDAYMALVRDSDGKTGPIFWQYISGSHASTARLLFYAFIVPTGYKIRLYLQESVSGLIRYDDFAGYVEGGPVYYAINNYNALTHTLPSHVPSTIGYPFDPLNIVDPALAVYVASVPAVPSTEGAPVGYYQSVEQAIIQCSSYCRYLGATLAWVTHLEPLVIFRPSDLISDYYVVPKGDYLELHTQVFNVAQIDSLGWHEGDTYWLDATIMLLRQVGGFIYQYTEDEHLVGSLIDNKGTDLSGSFLTPSLDTSGGLNTFGALFTPKNKISCTIGEGALVPGTSTAIDTYSTLETFALGYLTDGSLSSAIYNIPPTYDEGEYWWYMKDADHIYHSGTLMEYKDGAIVSLPKQMWTTDLYLDNVTPHDVPTSEDLIVTPSLGILPGTSYNLQLGVPAPNYPTFKGAFVFDLGLKKWGKLKADYKNLISFSPLNNNLGGAIAYTNFGMDSGIMNAAGEIRPFDTAPTDSWIRIGKIGYYRLGITNLLEVKAMFRSASTGSLTVDTSLDGRTLDPTLRHLTSFTGIANLTAYPDVSGRWHTIKIEGNYDLQYLEVRGTIAGRR